MKPIVKIGDKFNRLTAINFQFRRKKKDYWLFRCDCGKEKVIQAANVKYGHTKSCGCYNIEMTIRRSKTHGMTNIPEHHTWNLMRQRCSDKNYHLYHRYGGRGIKVCKRWLGKNGFQNFYSDMGKRPISKTSLDRVNNNGNYEPNNCRWATMKEQANNTKKNIFVSVNGIQIPFSELAEIFNIKTETLRQRIFNQHWDLKRALLQNPPWS